MKRGWFLLLALSLGLNAGLLFAVLRGPGTASESLKVAPPFIRPPQHLPGERPPNAPGPGMRPPGCPANHPVSGMDAADVLTHRRLCQMTKRLGLDPAQREEIRRFLGSMMPRILIERDAVQNARRAVRAEYGRTDTNPDRIRMLVRQQNEAQARLDSLAAEMVLLETAQMTPEQQRLYFKSMPWERRVLRPPNDGRHRRGTARNPG